jgi:aminoglycoside phosphotransferase (APT) family kinase protein
MHTTPLDFLEVLRRDGVVRNRDARLTPLTGGVSSEIYRVDDGDDSFVVKRALHILKVKEEWHADIDRNLHEQMYIDYVGRFLPGAVPALRDGAMDRGYFAMELLGAEFVNWKRLLMLGFVQIEHAVRAAELLGKIHARSVEDGEARQKFDTTENFRQLRIDPYLVTTGNRHPDLRPLFQAEAERLALAQQCLVHGDFSPKNIMISSSRMVLLDCEVAWYGDPAFDVAFLLTHLLLKGLFHAPREIGFSEMCLSFWASYVKQICRVVDWNSLETRVARLILMLVLARIDGKSPVEYLSQPHQADLVRRFAHTRLREECHELKSIFDQWFEDLKQLEMQQ